VAAVAARLQAVVMRPPALSRSTTRISSPRSGASGWRSEPLAITIMGSYPYLVVGDDDCHR